MSGLGGKADQTNALLGATCEQLGCYGLFHVYDALCDIDKVIDVSNEATGRAGDIRH